MVLRSPQPEGLGETSPRRVLVLGGARSGKSRFAEELAGSLGGGVLYVATAAARDAEMAERIRQHRLRRPAHWRTIEAATGLAEAVAPRLTGSATCVLVEDLTLLLSNLGVQEGSDSLAADSEARAKREVAALLELPAHVVLVSNEVGLGIVPQTPLGRAFRDALGRVNQAAAAAASEVYFLIAGLPMVVKGPGSR